MTFGERIKDRRLELGLTLKQLAEKLDISEATMQRYESGKIKNLSPEKVSRIAEALEMPAGWLLGEDETVTIEKHTYTMELRQPEYLLLQWFRNCNDAERSAIRALLFSMNNAKSRETELLVKLDHAEEFIEDAGLGSEYRSAYPTA